MPEVRAAKIESCTGILITKEKFAEFIVSEIAIKMSEEFEIIIKNVDRTWIQILFRGKNDPDWNRFVDVTEEFYEAMIN